MSADPADEVAPYLEELAERLADALGERLLSVIAGGSYALGGFDRRMSDIDLLVVVDRPLTVSDWDAVVDLTAHESLPVPARRLELTAYTRAQVAAPRRNQGWELHFTTGPGVRHAGFDPMAESWHWFVLDLAVARRHGVAVHGEQPREIIGEVSEALVQDAQAAAMSWYMLHEPGPKLLVAAARAWRWSVEKEFATKAGAWRWAADYVDKQYERG